MTLTERLTQDLKDAMKAAKPETVSTLRMAIAAVKNKEIEKRGATLSDEDVQAVLGTEVRKRKDAVAGFEAAGRVEQAALEAREITILKAYLPEEASAEDIRTAVQDAIAATGAAGAKDVGKVMGRAMAALKGRAEGGAVQAVARELLGA